MLANDFREFFFWKDGNSFRVKVPGEGGWINGGFFVLSTKVFDYIEGDNTIWESDPMERLAKESNMAAYMHKGYWQSMDSLNDKRKLEQIWATGKAPWKVW